MGVSSLEALHRLVVEKRKAGLSRADYAGIEKTFQDIGLPIIAFVEPPPLEEQKDARRRLLEMSAIRNVVEHNRSIINDEFRRLVPASNYKVGERIVITTTELGDALSAVEWTVDQLNHRAVEKFNIAASDTE